MNKYCCFEVDKTDAVCIGSSSSRNHSPLRGTVSSFRESLHSRHLDMYLLYRIGTHSIEFFIVCQRVCFDVRCLLAPIRVCGYRRPGNLRAGLRVDAITRRPLSILSKPDKLR